MVTRMNSKFLSPSHDVRHLSRTTFVPYPPLWFYSALSTPDLLQPPEDPDAFAHGVSSPESLCITPQTSPTLSNSYWSFKIVLKLPFLQRSSCPYRLSLRLWAHRKPCGCFYQSPLSAHRPYPPFAHKLIEDSYNIFILFIIASLMFSTGLSQKSLREYF